MQMKTWLRSASPVSSRFALFFFVALMFGTIAGSAGTLEEVRKRGVLKCGVSEGLLGFSYQGKDKEWSGFDVDYCRAVAAAVLGDPQKIEFVPLSAKTRFDALTDGTIDVLSRNTTWTMARDVVREFEFVGVSYYDGQGFMTRRSNGLSSALQLNQAIICLLDGTTAKANAEQYFTANNVKVTFRSFADRSALVEAYGKKECDVYSADRSGLASDRLRTKEPDAHMLLPEIISKEPLGPVVRQNDPQWADIARWVLFLIINAEERGWTKEAASAPNGKVRIVPSAEVNAKLGLDAAWCENVIKAVGNYGEIFSRNLGEDSRLSLNRGANSLWTRGGILYAPPMR